MAIFGPKRWVNFSTFWTSCCYSLERRFFVFEYRKRYFPGVYCLKKKLDKWPFLDQNHGLTPLGKCRIRHFPGLYCLKKKRRNNAIFWTKTMGWPVWRNVNFSTFWRSCFCSLERRFFVLEYCKRPFPGLYCLKKSWKNGYFLTKIMG